MVSSKTFITAAALATAVAAVPFPEAIAQLPGATMQCHEACGNLILESRKCSDNDCLCSSGSPFMDLAPSCLDCGWQLWSYYGKYLSEPLGKCNLPTEPTGVNPNATPATTAAEAPATTAEAPATTAEPETTQAPEQPAQSEPAQPEPETTKAEEPAQPEPETSSPEEPAAPATSAPVAPASSAPVAAASSAPAAPVTSGPAQVSSSAAAPVTSAKPSTSVKFGNTTIVTETICTKSACQNPKPTQTVIEQVNGATQYTVAGALAVVAGVAAFF
ncbi:hypothetical protein DV495_000113 [Geotrichum candidum]|nr:hypothetical protein DV452_003904 [Geotrichum candidum]KAF5136042.1 hypothetical protein DV495_000113 [Geotrichum candidum]KAI8131677.1 hypothetical protein DUD61_004659 [Geotrichum candidum]KAI9211924.1 hypothetical protein DS838_003181 [Geotrichum bryndzae]